MNLCAAIYHNAEKLTISLYYSEKVLKMQPQNRAQETVVTFMMEKKHRIAQNFKGYILQKQNTLQFWGK